jgi:hypothetical protein
MNIIENISMILNAMAIEPWEMFSYTFLGSVYIFWASTNHSSYSFFVSFLY